MIHSFKVKCRTNVAREKLHAIEYGSEIPTIDIFFSIYKIKRAWDGVSPSTIRNCFRKAGFNGDFFFDLDELCENEEDQYKEIVSFEKKLDFDKFAYVSIDRNLAARGMLSEAEIVDSIATNNPVEQDSDTEIEEQQDANKQVINSKEAIDRINELKQFFFNQKR
ncbi:tigger transposable element-derived 6-like [Brachionus plicatilis]|uniref:Tigger transposable element-derived 6-like n=1 Tax=Brachionus plicatilis TaxID=10195 RepID=A0A3M7SBN2_BRAPC|nr:tigger transposable element-derived 6-like [Brachionus plicatilis]